MENYHDYVIKDGKFIGKFEEMYKKFDDPWHQSEGVDETYERYATVTSINRFKLKSLVEVGCGLGYFSNFLKQNVPKLDLLGIDISETAITKAKQAFPNIEFRCEDLMNFLKRSNDNSDSKGYDAIMLSEIMWFILDDLDSIIEGINKVYKNKYVLINQTFYRDGVQKYGTDYFTSLKEMINRLPWKIINSVEIDDGENNILSTHSVFRVE